MVLGHEGLESPDVAGVAVEVAPAVDCLFSVEVEVHGLNVRFYSIRSSLCKYHVSVYSELHGWHRVSSHLTSLK